MSTLLTNIRDVWILIIELITFVDNQIRSLEVQLEHAERQLKDRCSCGGVKTLMKSGRHSIGTPGEIVKSKSVVTTVTKGKRKETTFDVVTSKSIVYSRLLI